MSLSLERWIRKVVNGPYGRWILFGLFAFILVIFTVTDEMTDFIRGLFTKSERAAASDVAGTFYVLPGSPTEVTFSEFSAAREQYRIAMSFLGRSAADPRSVDVWTHLVVRAAAERERIAVSDEEVRDLIKSQLPDFIYNDREQYRRWVNDAFRVQAPVFEAALRDFLVAARLRELYRESYFVAPATTRAAAIAQSASQSIEYASGDYAVLDASRFVAEAEAELKAEPDANQKLRDFFEKDAEVKLEETKFRQPRRWRLEVLYTIHKNVDTEEARQRIVAVVRRAYPAFEPKDVPVKDLKDHYGTYRDRLLEAYGKTWKQVSSDFDREQKGTGEAAPAEGEKPPAEGEAPAEELPVEEPADPVVRQKLLDYGYQIVQDQVRRELDVKSVFAFLQDQARNDVSLKEIYDRLKAADDADRPVCATEPGKGLIVYRDFGGQGLTTEELQEIEDSGVKFGFSFVPKVTRVGTTDLPKKGPNADTLGDAGHGRQILRLLEVIPEQRRTYDELSDAEKEDLRRDFYLPSRAREKAKEKLEALRQRFVEGTSRPEDFKAEAEALGCRVRQGEWFEASFDILAEPERKKLWPDQYVHMRERHFLRKSLADVLSRDREKGEHKAGSFLPVVVDTRREGGGAGAAYLFLLRERKRPDATTIPPSEVATQLFSVRSQRFMEERERWVEHPERLISAFRMEFHPEMRERIDDELKKIEEGRKRGGTRQ